MYNIGSVFSVLLVYHLNVYEDVLIALFIILFYFIKIRIETWDLEFS
jgi:hypothetical protein